MNIFAWFFPKPKPPRQVNVRKGVVTAILSTGETITITKYGWVCSDYTTGPEGRVFGAMEKKWITDDDGICWNRNYIRSYTVEYSDYFVWDKPVSEG
jgi:hypothetical protein